MISIVVPAYNEAKKLNDCVVKLQQSIEGVKERCEIIIAEDGSTDNTLSIAKKLAKSRRNVKVFHFSDRLGRGMALEKAFRKARGRILIYMDTDLSTDLKHIKDLVGKIDEGYDIVTGSRNLEKSVVRRSLRRSFASIVYNFLVRTMFGINIHDMQCGFKAFKRKSLFEIVGEVKDTYWFWDTEILLRAYKKGYKLAEIPVKWDERKESKVRLFHDSLYFMGKLIGLKATI